MQYAEQDLVAVIGNFTDTYSIRHRKSGCVQRDEHVVYSFP